MENNEAVSFQNDLREGNWTAVNQYIRSKQEGEAVSAKFSYARRTALHIAVLAGKINIVKELVKIMPKESLLMKDKDGVTVLGSCAIVGNIKMAKCIIEKSQNLLSIENGKDELIPVVLALTCNPDTIEMARYLYDKTPKEDLMPGRGVNGATFITRCIYAKAFYMASTLLKCYPTLATALDIKKESPVFALATVSFAYPSGNQLIFWKQWIYNSICIPSVDATSELPISNKTLENGNIDQVRFPGSGHGFVLNLLKLLGINQICEMKLLHHQSRKLLLLMVKRLPGLSPQQLQNGLVTVAIIRAAKKGKVEFIASILEACPELVWYEEITSQRNLFMCAVLHRQSEVFGHLYGFLYKNSILPRGDSHNNSILHMAAMLEASTTGRNAVRGAAIHMQSELKWFKEVENIVHPSLLEAVNNEGQTPGELFTESHKDLVKAGEKWMKQRATSCTVVCALIVSIMFAAAITVPGGNDQNTGYPMFFKKKVFTLFITADALSLVSATTSLLMFLNILTSRYAEEDFLKSLPKKMMIGLSTLIFSTATMMITFCACLLIILHEKFRIVIPIICFASVPVTQFALMQFHLVNEMFISTYGSGILDKKVKPWS